MTVLLEKLPNVTPIESVAYTRYRRDPNATDLSSVYDIRWQLITEPDETTTELNGPPQTIQRLGELVTKLQALLIPYSTVDPNAATRSACPLARTNLTDLFADTYGADATVFQVPKSNKAYRLHASAGYPKPPDFIDLSYQISYPRFALPFWEVRVRPDGVRMVCGKDDRVQIPLAGSGTVTELPRLMDALFADAAILESTPHKS